MTLLWFDGFELDRTLTSLALNYNNITGWSTTIANTVGRFGGKSLKSEVDTVTNILTNGLPWTTSPIARLVYIGIAIRCNAPGNTNLFSMIGGIVALTSWEVKSLDNLDGTYSLELYDADSILLDTSEDIPYSEWVYVEVSVMGQSTGDWSWRLNDAEIGSGTSNFLPAVPQDQLLIQWPSLSVGFIEYDDLYITEDGFLGKQFLVEGLVPASDRFIEWQRVSGINNYGQVNDPGDSDGDASYVFTDNDGDTDKYGMTSLLLIQGAIHAIRWQVDARNDDGINREITPEFVVDGQTAIGTPVLIMDQVYQRVAEILVNNPTTSNPWVKSDFSNIQIGMTKGVSPGLIALTVIDELGTIGYMDTDDPNEWFLIYDEAGLQGEMDTKASNTQLALLDESQIEGEFDLVVL